MYDFYGQHKSGANISLGGATKKVGVRLSRIFILNLRPCLCQEWFLYRTCWYFKLIILKLFGNAAM